MTLTPLGHNRGGRFREEDGELMWVEERSFPLADTGGLYVAYQEKDDPHAVYKLQKVGHDVGLDPPFFAWYGLWNTCVITGGPPESRRPADRTYRTYRFPSIRAAIEGLWARKEGWVAVRLAGTMELAEFLIRLHDKRGKTP